MARQKFRCTDCGLRVEGRMDAKGWIRAYDRASSDPNAKEQGMVCPGCEPAQPRGVLGRFTGMPGQLPDALMRYLP